MVEQSIPIITFGRLIPSSIKHSLYLLLFRPPQCCITSAACLSWIISRKPCLTTRRSAYSRASGKAGSLVMIILADSVIRLQTTMLGAAIYLVMPFWDELDAALRVLTDESAYNFTSGKGNGSLFPTGASIPQQMSYTGHPLQIGLLLVFPNLLGRPLFSFQFE